MISSSPRSNDFSPPKEKCTSSTSGAIEYLGNEIRITMSKLNLAKNTVESINEYIARMNEIYYKDGAQPQSFLAPKTELGEINYVEFLNQLFPSLFTRNIVLFSNFELISWAVALTILLTLFFTFIPDWIIFIVIGLFMAVDRYPNSLLYSKSTPSLVDENKLLRKLGMELYTLRQVYCIGMSGNVHAIVVLCGYLVYSDRVEILKILNAPKSGLRKSTRKTNKKSN